MTSLGASAGGHTSSTIWMSLPSASCTSTAPSGVRRCFEPSYTLLNTAPLSSTFGSSEKI
jgi:hypothetical protein